jgi:mono/diheme cytochrome c family protein
MNRLFLVTCAFLLAAAARADDLTFEKHVRPLLKAHCFECHGEGPKLRGGLDLRLVRLMRHGGDSGPALSAGQPKESPLLERVRSGEMPPGDKKLGLKDIELLEQWIAAGARTARPEPASIAQGFVISAEEEAFWSFQPLQPGKPRDGRPWSVARTPVDAYILERLQEKSLGLSPEADAPTLLRRVHLDLIGLPPTPAEVDAFVAASARDREMALAQAIDRLLESPHYGERWGRHWLDVAGYADSEGFTGEDPPRSSAWRYRDYVIRAFNEDRPWDEFIREQLAGDELVRPPYQDLQGRDLERLIATGFLRMAPDGSASKEVDLPAAMNQTMADTIQIVSTAFLGLTIHCAQCHNHRYDPIPQSDYYRLRAVFEPALDWKKWRRPAAREVAVLSAAERARAGELEKEAAALDSQRTAQEQAHLRKFLEAALQQFPAEVRDQLRAAYQTPALKRSKDDKALLAKHPQVLGVTLDALLKRDKAIAAEVADYKERAAQVRARKPAPLSVRALTEVPGEVPVTYLFHRGDHDAPKEPLAPGTPLLFDKYALGVLPAQDAKRQTTGRRLALASWLTHDQNPLTARVLVNRFWMHHFGRGLVNTPGDFGALGETPSHPELLDWLAREFIAGGWKLKPLQRLIMMSAVYRQSSTRTPQLQQIDPDNRLLGRMPVRRLEAETLRDVMLAVSGKLNRKAFGPPVPIRSDEVGQVVIGVDTNDGAGRPTGKFVPLGGEEYRRSVYVTVRRSKPLGMLETFDGPLVTPTCVCRTPTTVAPQSLLLMNNEAVAEQAFFFAQRLQQEAGTDLEKQVAYAWRCAYAEEPETEEVARGVAFVERQRRHLEGRKDLPAGKDASSLALANFCQALLISNEFLYVE